MTGKSPTITVRFEVKTVDALRCKTSCAIVPVFEKGTLLLATHTIDKATGGLVTRLLQDKDIDGTSGQLLLVPRPSGIAAERLLLVGCGKRGDMNASAFFNWLAKLSGWLKQHPVHDLTLFLDDIAVTGQDHEWIARHLAQSFQQLDYRFEQLKSRPAAKRTLLKQVTIACADKSQHRRIESGLTLGKATANGMMLAKDLGNLPGNICTPGYLAGQARELARQHTKLHCKILDEAQMKKLGMGSFLSVTAGTEQPARMIIVEYHGAAKNNAPYVLIGKGITFDSGGISLKPGPGMDEMKYDMCGAASVLGTLLAISELGLAVNVVGILAAAENMPSGHASRPGDIVTSMSGQTIEILNTDAEGRLVLCDALTYAARYQPKTVIDIATLTGACIVALGNHAHGLFSNDDAFARELLDAGVAAHDRAWQMPLWEEYDKQLKSPFADMANIGGPNGASVTAACFLARFAKTYTWAHLDIAGTAWNKGENKGSTARPVPLLVHYLLAQAGKLTVADRTKK